MAIYFQWPFYVPLTPPFRNRIRTKVIVISSKGNLSYAKILKKFNADPNLRGNVNRIRRTQEGDLMLEAKRSTVGKTDSFRTQVKNSLEEDAAVRSVKMWDLHTM